MTELEFTKKRVGFAIVNGKVLFQKKSDRIPTLQWMKDKLKLSNEEIESTIRGGLFEDRITFCVGSNYMPADLSSIPASVFIKILQAYYLFYGDYQIDIWNGSIIGNIGDVWTPRSKVGKAHPIISEVTDVDFA